MSLFLIFCHCYNNKFFVKIWLNNAWKLTSKQWIHLRRCERCPPTSRTMNFRPYIRSGKRTIPNVHTRLYRISCSFGTYSDATTRSTSSKKLKIMRYNGAGRTAIRKDYYGALSFMWKSSAPRAAIAFTAGSAQSKHSALAVSNERPKLTFSDRSTTLWR